MPQKAATALKRYGRVEEVARRRWRTVRRRSAAWFADYPRQPPSPQFAGQLLADGLFDNTTANDHEIVIWRLA